MHQEGAAKARPCFLFPFLTFIAQNLTTYMQQQTQNLKPDWRIKKALISALGHLNEHIAKEKDQVWPQLEKMLVAYTLPEL